MEPRAPAEPEMRWVPALVIESKATPSQRARNFALYQRLRDGQIGPRNGVQENGLVSFVYDVPIERLSIGPCARSFSFRLQKDDECFRRLLSVISDHFDTKCDADDEVERLRTALAEIRAYAMEERDPSWNRQAIADMADRLLANTGGA